MMSNEELHKLWKDKGQGMKALKSVYQQGRNDAIEEFADYLRMSYDKGMRLSAAMCKNEIEKFKLKALYSRFIDAIDDCVKAFNELEQLKEQKE